MNNPIFATNIAKLNFIYPDLLKTLTRYYEQSKKSVKMELELDEGRCTTLKVNGRQLTSHHDREGLSKFKCRKLDLKRDVYLLGFGLGDEIRYIHKTSPKTKIKVVLLNPALFYLLLSIDDEIHTLLSDKVEFIIPENFKDPILNSVICTPELYLQPEVFGNLKARLISRLDDDFANTSFTNNVLTLHAENLKKNVELLKTEIPLHDSDLEGLTDNVIITASGPSLEHSVDKLRELKAKGYTHIACDTALKFLREQNLLPDIILSTDAIVYRHLKNVLFTDIDDLKNCFLIYSAHSEYDLITDFKGKKRFIYKERDIKYVKHLDKKHADFIVYHGSVLNEAVAIALKSGCSKIHLLGCDFAYLGNSSHAADVNAIPEISNKLQVMCNDGRLQNTVRNFSLYRQYLEDEIEKNRNVKFYNYSKTGAVIKGAIRA
ncbi:MAG: motility associated factor glycosyltransferase family protein [Succinivibrio sp.]